MGIRTCRANNTMAARAIRVAVAKGAPRARVRDIRRVTIRGSRRVKDGPRTARRK